MGKGPLRAGERVKVVERRKTIYGVVGLVLSDGLVVVDFADGSSLSYPPEKVRRR